jgi:hypothetical protein
MENIHNLFFMFCYSQYSMFSGKNMFLASTQSSTVKVVLVIYFEPYQYKRTVKTYTYQNSSISVHFRYLHLHMLFCPSENLSSGDKMLFKKP